jgi:TolB-like protein/Flp pilus assembly protein TadD
VQPGQKPARPVLAVLPFVNRSGLKEDDFFAIGMVEDIIDALSLSRSIRVLSSGATAAYRRNAVDVVEIARQANVRYLLEGNVRRVVDALRVTAQLIDAADGGVLWSQKFDRPLSELAALQEDLVSDVAAHLGGQISRVEMERALKKPGDLNAWEAMLRSGAAATRGLWDTAIAEAEKAVALAPDSAVAHTTLAFAISGMVLWRPGEPQWRECSHSHIVRALELDAANPTVHLWAGWSYAWCQDPAEGLPFLEQAVRARPTNAVARHGLGSAYLMLNRNQEALTEWETAERLAPGSPNQYNLSGFIGCALMKLGQFEEALARFDQSLGLLPTFFFAHFFRAFALERLGQGEAAAAAMHRARALDISPQGANLESIFQGVVESWWRNHPDLPYMLAAMQKLSDATRGDAK